MALQYNCSTIIAAENGRELVQHGSALFPIVGYVDDITLFAVPWHWHEDFEYILAAEGTLTVGVSQARLVLREGEGVFINSGALHAVEQGETGPAVLHSCVFHPRLVGGVDTIFWQKLVAPLLQPGVPPYFLLDGTAPWQREALAWLDEVWQDVAAESDEYENRVRYRLSSVLRLLCAQCAAQTAPVSQQQQIAADRVKQMLRFIEEHYAEELTVERIAASVALSESACLRSFRQLLGTTPIQYVKQFRVERAAELLRTTRLKIGDIGAECGFADGSYFIKTFRAVKHCTPKEYREKYAKEPQPTPSGAFAPAPQGGAKITKAPRETVVSLEATG